MFGCQEKDQMQTPKIENHHGFLSVEMLLMTKWRTRQDLNLEPSDPKSDTLSN